MKYRRLTVMITIQDIAPNYYDLSTFSKGPVKSALERAVQKIRRKDAQKSQYSKR